MQFSTLLADLLGDLRDPGILWQLAAIAFSVLLGWGMARMMHKTYMKRAGTHAQLVRFNIDNLAAFVGPLLMVAFVAISRYALAPFHQVHVLRVALPLFASFATIRTAFFLLRRVFARQGQVGAAILTFEKIIALTVWAAVALYIMGLWPDIFDYLNDTTLPLGRNKVSLWTILQGGASVVVLLILALWAGTALEERLMNVDSLHSSLRVVMARSGRALLIVVAVLLSLSMVGIDLTVLSVFGGALGVGLGFGMQKIASNYVSGFIILLERSLTIGDVITVDKFAGKVTQINTRYTVLQGLDGIESVLPNEMLVSGAVQSYSLTNRQTRVATQLTVTYDSDLKVLLPLLEKVTAEVARVLADPPPAATLNKFGSDGFELEVGFWINDPENGRGGVMSEVNKRIWELLQSEQFKLPFPMRDTRFLDARIASVLAGLPAKS